MKQVHLPSRGEIWVVELDPVVGHEQPGRRPALVVSADTFNHGPAELLTVIPITSVLKGIHSHVPVGPGTSGLDVESFAICEQIRCISRQRLLRRIGRAPRPVMAQVGRWLRVLLHL